MATPVYGGDNQPQEHVPASSDSPCDGVRKCEESWARLQSQGDECLSEYRNTLSEAVLARAIRHLKDALEITPLSHPARAEQHYALGVGYAYTYTRQRQRGHLDQATHHFEAALEGTHDVHPQRMSRVEALASTYERHFYLHGNELSSTKTNFLLAVKYFTEALALAPMNYPQRASILEHLGSIHVDDFLRRSDPSSLQEGIRYHREALDETQDDDPRRARRLLGLGVGHHNRYQTAGADRDLTVAMQYYQSALEATTTQSLEIDRVECLHWLGKGHIDEYEITGEETVLVQAFQRLEEAVKTTPKEDTHYASRLRSLARVTRLRFERTESEEDMALSIQQSREVIDATPKSSPQWASHTRSLGNAYYFRHLRNGAKADLDLAIQCHEEAVKETHDGDREYVYRLQSLAASYDARYRRMGAESDRALAVQRYEEAIHRTAQGHALLPQLLDSLGRVYGTRHGRQGHASDLTKATELFEKALEITQTNDPDRPGRLALLGASLLTSYQHDQVVEKLDQSLAYLGETLSTAPNTSPLRASWMAQLGDAHHEKHHRTKSPTDLTLALQYLSDALAHPSSEVRDRLRAARALFKLRLEVHSPELAYEAALAAMNLVPLLTPRFLSINDKQHLLTQISALASHAAALALIAGRSAYDAIQMLELGRSVILGDLGDMRADVSDLMNAYPRYAEDFVELRDRLNVTAHEAVSAGLQSAMPRQSLDRVALNKQLEKKIEDIRHLDGFSRFLLAPSEEEIRTAATSGPIVIVNVSMLRCDALIIETRGLNSVLLPALTRDDIAAYEAALTIPEDVGTDMLEWLWDAIAKPVLDALEPIHRPDDSIRRIWWILTGRLTKFPIHAAGYHSDGSSDTVLDQFISSYSPSVKALVRNRQSIASKARKSTPGLAVLVGVDKTQSQEDLGFVADEINQLESLCSSLQLQVIRPLPNQEDVLAALRRCDIFHFAGHGLSHRTDPLSSSLLLYDGSLTVSQLFEINLHHRMPFLAYLSACGTGQVKSNQIIDETLHMIAAYQIAGFQHVIGTLWNVDDECCAKIAAATYLWLENNGMSSDSVSEGLHHATRALRSQWITETQANDLPAAADSARILRDTSPDIPTPLYWVPFTHFGL